MIKWTVAGICLGLGFMLAPHLVSGVAAVGSALSTLLPSLLSGAGWLVVGFAPFVGVFMLVQGFCKAVDWLYRTPKDRRL